MAESENHRRDPAAEPQAPLSPTAGDLRWLRGRGVVFRQARVRLGAVIALAIAGGFLAWAASDGGGGGGSPPPNGPVAGTGPVALSYSGLRKLAGVVGQPIYWVGTKPGTMYELTRTADRKVYLRYLPAGVQAGDPRPLLTIGTYPMKNPFSVTRAAARAAGSTLLQPGDGAVAFYGRNSQTNAYIAFPRVKYQIEVYSPTPHLARRLITQGAVRSVAAAPPVKPGTTAVSPGGLRSLSRKLGQPMYWAGPQAGVSYELTQESSGPIFVRYLPRGVKVGGPGSYLTVGTYPVAGALAATTGLGKSPGNTLLKLSSGGVAAYKKRATTKSVYVAYPGADYQVEVFDPTAGDALKLVKSGWVVAIR